MRVEIWPRRNHSGARHEAERWLHSDHTGELRGNAIRSTVVGAERGERHSVRDGDGRSGAGTTRRLRAGWIVRIQHLSGMTAGSVAVIRKIVSGRFAENDGACCTKARDFDRVSSYDFWKEPRPLGVRGCCRQSIYVIDRLREH